MILRSTLRTPVPFQHPGPPRPAHELFLGLQFSSPQPHAFVRQVEHSQVAGRLVEALLPAPFGELPPEAAEAAAKHDLGWGPSDERLLAEGAPKPFALVPEDELPSWRRSLEMARAWSPLTRVLIGRHFAALAGKPTEAHAEFLANDAREIDREAASFPAPELERWTDAIGFCDLLALYLCTGLRAPAIFPLAHPALPRAAGAPHITVSWTGDRVRLSQPVFQPATRLRASVAGTSEPLIWELI